MKLGLSKMFDEWFDEHRRLALANKRRGRSNHRLGSRYSHRPEEKHSEFADEPLENPIVEAELDKGHKEDDRLKKFLISAKVVSKAVGHFEDVFTIVCCQKGMSSDAKNNEPKVYSQVKW